MEELFPMLIAIVMLLLILKFMISAIAGSFLSRGALDHMWGDLASRIVRFFVLAPFRLIRWFVRLLGGKP